jgi:hypothetical protein
MVQQAKLGEILAALFCVGILHSQAFTIPRATATRATSVTMSASGTEATEQVCLHSIRQNKARLCNSID